MSAEQVRASQRARIVHAMTESVGEYGYHGVRVADVVSRAGVSRKTFYELFGGKDDCFRDIVATGEGTQQRREQAAKAFARLFEYPTVPDDPLGVTLRASRVSELSETLRREIAADRTEQLPGLLPELMCAMVLPFLGMKAARRELARNAAPAR